MNTFVFPTNKYGLTVHHFKSNADFKQATKRMASKFKRHKIKVAKSTLIGPLAL